jgi:hypothetical protein
MNTKLLLQVILALGCLAMLISTFESVVGRGWLTSAEGWWRAAIACWLLVVAIRMVYPAHGK